MPSCVCDQKYKSVNVPSGLIPRIAVTYELKIGNELTALEKEQIRTNYESNGFRWYNERIMMSPYYYFVVAIVNSVIIGQGGINLNGYELDNDCIHTDYQHKGIYKELLKRRVEYIRTESKLRDRIYYLLTDKLESDDDNKKKIKNHLESGLVKLDRDINESNPNVKDGVYKSLFKKHKSREYITLNIGYSKNYLAFRTSGYDDTDIKEPRYVFGCEKNFVQYRFNGSNYCSGLYLGNGLIVTAGHCHYDEFRVSERTIEINTVTFRNIDVNINILEDGRNIFHDHPLRNLHDGPKNGPDIVDIALIDISSQLNEIPGDLEEIIICRDPGNVTLDEDLFAWGKNSKDIRKGMRKGTVDIETFERHHNSHHVKGLTKLPRVLAKKYDGISETIRDDVPDRTDFTETLAELQDRLSCICQTSSQNMLTRGDSGGPLFFVNSNKQFILIGSVGAMGSGVYCDYCYIEDYRGNPVNALVSFANTSPNILWIKRVLERAKNPIVRNSNLITIGYKDTNISLI